jgi:hypothetical protein
MCIFIGMHQLGWDIKTTKGSGALLNFPHQDSYSNHRIKGHKGIERKKRENIPKACEKQLIVSIANPQSSNFSLFYII